jgi:hypothetical protein
MAFKNEYIPPLEQETSEFFKKARETLRTGHSKYDQWTVDRERNMVLFRRGGGHSMESKDEDYWSFIVADREHYVDTEVLAKSEVTPEEIAITYSVSFRGDQSRYPDAQTIACIEQALQERGRTHLFDLDHHKRCHLTLIDATTGKEI